MSECEGEINFESSGDNHKEETFEVASWRINRQSGFLEERKTFLIEGLSWAKVKKWQSSWVLLAWQGVPAEWCLEGSQSGSGG